MQFIDVYNTKIPPTFKKVNTKNFSSKESAGLISLANAIDSVLESVISSQETGIPFKSLIFAGVQSSVKRSSVGPILITIIEDALDVENLVWKTNWATAKTIANSLQPPPAGAGFPSFLKYSLPIPSSFAPAGVGQPIPTGNLFLEEFTQRTKKMGKNALYIGETIKTQIAFFYNKWQSTGPKPYNPIA